MANRPGLLSPQHLRLSIAIYTTIALVAFEGTSVAAAIPDIAAELGDVDLIPWVITGFLVTLGLSTVIAGPFVDALGSRSLFVWSTVLFAGSGFAAGLVDDVALLVAIRLVQGASSGFLFAAAIAAVNLGFPEELTGRAFAANATIWGIMGAAAPAIAAVLLDVASWRWLFFINLPLGAIAWLAGRSTMPERLPDAEPLHVDLVGSVLAGVFSTSMILAVDDLSLRSVGYGAAAALAVGLYVRHARRVERPLVSLRHIAEQPFASLALVPSLMLAAAFCANVYVTLYVSGGRGWSTGAAAWSVIFFTVGWTVGANVSSRLLDATTGIKVMTLGLVVGWSGSVATALGAIVDVPVAVAFGGLFVLGIGIGLNTNASLPELRAATPPAQIGRASAANQFARSQGFAVGAATGGAVLLFVVDRQLGSVEPVRRLLAGDEVDDLAGNVTLDDVAGAVRDGYGAATAVSVVVMSVAFVPMLRLVRRDEAVRDLAEPGDSPTAADRKAT